MPGMSGHDVCRRFKVDDALRSIPVIFISALHEVVDKVHAFESGGADYVTKPFEFGEVLVRIDNQLRIQRLQRDLEQRNARILTTLSDILLGTVLDGKFRLDEKLGSGGFGTVYRATQLNLARLVAVIRLWRESSQCGRDHRFRRVEGRHCVPRFRITRRTHNGG